MAAVLKTGKTAVARRGAASALNRRSLLMSGMAAAGALSASAKLDAAQDAAKAANSTRGASERNANVVLAHGAWADGSSWSKVIAGLNAKGVKALAAPLPLTSLEDDIVALDRTFERLDGPVVLAGHAYAGAVIAGTRYEKVKALVYIVGTRAG